MTPIMLKRCFDGFNLQRERQDSDMWLWFGTYGISAFSFAIDHCVNGREAKTEYLEHPLLSKKDDDGEMSEEELKKQREEFVLKMQTMKANFDIAHRKNI